MKKCQVTNFYDILQYYILFTILQYYILHLIICEIEFLNH